MAAPLDGVTAVPAKHEKTPDRLHEQGVDLLSGPRHFAHLVPVIAKPSVPNKPVSLPIGDDVTFDAHVIYRSTRAGEIQFLSEAGLNNWVLNDYKQGHLHAMDVAAGRVKLENLSPRERQNLDRYHVLHDALSFKAHQFAVSMKDPALEGRLMREWEPGFLRGPQERKRKSLWERFIQNVLGEP